MTSATTQQIMAAAVHSYCKSQSTSHNTAQFLQPPSIIDNKNQDISVKVIKDVFDPLWINGFSESAPNATIVGSGESGIATAVNTTEYWFVIGSLDRSTTEANVEYKIRQAGTFKFLAVRIAEDSANGIAADTPITFRKNGADTAMGVTVQANGQGLYEDLNDSVHVDAGDTVCVKTVPGAATGQMTITTITLIFVPDDPIASFQFMAATSGAGENVNTASTTYWSAINGSPFRTTTSESRAKIRQRITATYKFFYLYVTSNTRITDTVFKSRKNGADGNLIITVPAGVTGPFEDIIHQDDVVSGDDYNFQITSGSGGATNLNYTIIAVTMTNTLNSGVFITAQASGQNLSAGNDRFSCYMGKEHITTSGSINRTKRRIRLTKILMFDMIVNQFTNTLTNDSFFKNLKNASPTNLVVTVPGSAADGIYSNTTDIDTLGVNDDSNFEMLASAIGTTLGMHSIIAYYKTPRISKSFRYPYNITKRAQSKSLLFDGVNDYLDCGNHSDLWSQGLTKFSFSIWIYPTLIDSNFRDCLSHGGAGAHGIRLYYEGDNFTFAIRDSGASEKAAHSAATPINNWYNAVCVYDSTLGANQNLAIYINKTKVSGGTLTETINNSSILSLANSSTDLQGNTKDFRFKAGVAWTQTDVNNIYDDSPSAPIPDYWLPMNEGSGAPVDIIKGKTTTLNGPTWETRSPGQLGTKTFRFPYRIVGRISKQFRFVYNIAQRISKQFRFPYNIKQRISKIFRYPYNVVGRISKQFRFPYNIIQRTSKQFRFPYNIVARISKQFRFLYNIRQRISKQFRFPYNIVARISKQFRYPYNIKQRISKQFQFPYNIKQRISKQFTFLYNILSEGIRVSKTFQFPYNIVGRTSKQFRFPYNITVRISKQFRFLYNIIQRISKQFRFPYNIKSRVIKTFRFPYNIQQRISKQFRFPYNIKQRISKTFRFPYDILSELIRVSKTFRFPYNITVRVSRTFRFPYNIARPIRRITHEAGAFGVRLKIPTRGIAKMLWDRIHDDIDG